MVSRVAAHNLSVTQHLHLRAARPHIQKPWLDRAHNAPVLAVNVASDQDPTGDTLRSSVVHS
jgi:hypothetical protein